MNTLRRAIVCFLVLGLFSSLTFSQSVADRGNKSGEIIDKIRQLDLMNHILPIIFTKEQLNGLLPAVEKARQNVVKTELAEADILLKIDGQVSKALDKAIDEGTLPGKQMIIDLDKYFNAMQETRDIVGKDNEDMVYKFLNDNCNAGQRKAMANSVDPHSINPALKTETMSDEEKIRFYIRNILLDPLAYPLLVKMSRSTATPSK